MSEKLRQREVVKTGVLLGTGLAILTYLAMHGFSSADKMEAFHRQGCCCALCHGQHRKWEGHHNLPKSEGGTNTLDNLSMVGGDRGRDCHEVLDRKAIDHGQIFDPATGTFTHVSELPPERFKNERIRQKTLKRFSVSEVILNTVDIVKEAIERVSPIVPDTQWHKHAKHRRGKKLYRGQGGRRRR